MTSPEFIYKITTRALFEKAEKTGILEGMPIDRTDGYMHFSTAEQLGETLSRHFAGQSELMLLAVHTDAVADALKWEISRGDALFPHLYEPLKASKIAWSAPIAVAADGTCQLPGTVR